MKTQLRPYLILKIPMTSPYLHKRYTVLVLKTHWSPFTISNSYRGNFKSTTFNYRLHYYNFLSRKLSTNPVLPRTGKFKIIPIMFSLKWIVNWSNENTEGGTLLCSKVGKPHTSLVENGLSLWMVTGLKNKGRGSYRCVYKKYLIGHSP